MLLAGMKPFTFSGAATMNAEESGFLLSIKKNPGDLPARRAYADWLEEYDRPYEAMLQRGQSGLSEVFFKLRRKSDGLFSEGPDRTRKWSSKGKMWRKLSTLRANPSQDLGQQTVGSWGW